MRYVTMLQFLFVSLKIFRLIVVRGHLDMLFDVMFFYRAMQPPFSFDMEPLPFWCNIFTLTLPSRAEYLIVVHLIYLYSE
jgi:hypothetical protein